MQSLTLQSFENKSDFVLVMRCEEKNQQKSLNLISLLGNLVPTVNISFLCQASSSSLRTLRPLGLSGKYATRGKPTA